VWGEVDEDAGELPLPVGARVRLTVEYQGVARGAEGIVRGYYRSDPPRYAVDFGGPSRQVPPEYLEPLSRAG
jgi:hypothetical protein